jgi:hypothetical protein
MTSLLSRAIAAIRVWIGMNDPADNRLHASHGWLLPSPADVRAYTLEQALMLVPLPVSPAPRRRR